MNENKLACIAEIEQKMNELTVKRRQKTEELSRRYADRLRESHAQYTPDEETIALSQYIDGMINEYHQLKLTLDRIKRNHDNSDTDSQ